MTRDDFEDLDPAVYCLRHGQPLLISEYGHACGGCAECQPLADPEAVVVRR